MMKQSYEDYKYVMLDTAFLYLGAKYNYGEIIENEDIPFKFRAVARHLRALSLALAFSGA